MSRRHLAKVRWIRSAEGGRTRLPAGPTYMAPSKVNGLPSDEITWDMVLEFDSAPTFEHPQIVTAYFRNPKAPHEALTKGATFGLYEGRNCVLTGEILD